MQKSKSRKILILVLMSLLVLVTPVFAESYDSPTPAYIMTTTPNDYVLDYTFWAYQDINNPTTFSNITIGWQVVNGDIFGIKWYDSSGVEINVTTLSATNNGLVSTMNITAPGGAVTSKLFLNSSATSGTRYVYYLLAENNLGNHTHYPAPSMSSSEDIPQVDIGWGSPTVPTGILPPEELAKVVLEPDIYIPSIREKISPTQPTQTIPKDSGGNAQIVTTPTYSLPPSVESPLPLPSVPDPYASLPPRVLPTPREVPLTKDLPYAKGPTIERASPQTRTGVYEQSPTLIKEGAMIKDTILTKDTPLVKDNQVRQAPMTRTPMSREVIIQDPLMNRDPVPLQDPIP